MSHQDVGQIPGAHAGTCARGQHWNVAAVPGSHTGMGVPGWGVGAGIHCWDEIPRWNGGAGLGSWTRIRNKTKEGEGVPLPSSVPSVLSSVPGASPTIPFLH